MTTETMAEDKPMPLEGIRVIDAATLFAAPLVASLLADFGADVVKVEHPVGDILRKAGPSKNGVSVDWIWGGRNKRSVVLKMSEPEGAEVLKELIADADILVENFRTGTMERWGLGWDVLKEINPRLIMVRTTGFGQTGPYARRPGYGTLAEAMSGFASMNGYPDGPPTLPPFGLGDAVAGTNAAFAVMVALWWRERSGKGQYIDMSIYEPLYALFGPQTVRYDQLGIVPQRHGNGNPNTALRNAFKTKDGKWLAISAVHLSIAERIMRLVGRDDMTREPWFASPRGRFEHVEEVDGAVAEWIAARDAKDVIAAFDEAEAAISMMMTMEDIFEDPQYEARESIAKVEHPILGTVRIPNVFPILSETPGRIRYPGTELGSHTEEVLRDELGYSDEKIQELAEKGITRQLD
jgi:formyl-CoA transferase